MNAIAYLQEQLANINTVFHAIAGDVTAQEWVARLAPGQNMLGSIVWHMPRAQDTTVQTLIRGIPEIAHGDRWAHWQPLRRLGSGVGISLEEADEIARRVQRADVMEYADAVHQANMAWLNEIGEKELDQIPDVRRHLSHFPEYQTPGFVEQARSLLDEPIWSQLMRPCIGHIHRHLGELEAAKNILRSQT